MPAGPYQGITIGSNRPATIAGSPASNASTSARSFASIALLLGLAFGEGLLNRLRGLTREVAR